MPARPRHLPAAMWLRSFGAPQELIAAALGAPESQPQPPDCPLISLVSFQQRLVFPPCPLDFDERGAPIALIRESVHDITSKSDATPPTLRTSERRMNWSGALTASAAGARL